MTDNMQSSIKRISFALLFLPLLFSCTTHYVATWQNSIVETENFDDSLFAIKNDTIGVSHAFNDKQGKFQIRIENYTDNTMVIDLTKSATTINGQAFGYVDGVSTITGNLNQFGNRGNASFGSFDGKIISNTNTIFVPAKSFVEGQFTNLRNELQNRVGDNIDGIWGNYPVFDVHIYSKAEAFQKDNTPISLTSFVNYSLLDSDNNPIKTDMVSQSFYLAKVSKISSIENSILQDNLNKRKYMSSYSITKGGNLGLGLFAVGLIGLAIIVGPTE